MTTGTTITYLRVMLKNAVSEISMPNGFINKKGRFCVSDLSEHPALASHVPVNCNGNKLTLCRLLEKLLLCTSTTLVKIGDSF